MSEKNERVHALVNDGPWLGMSEAFDAHMGAACWTDQAYAPDASMWAAAWKAAVTAERAQTVAVVDKANSYIADNARFAEQVESLRAEIARLDAAAKYAATDWVDDDVRVRHPRA